MVVLAHRLSFFFATRARELARQAGARLVETPEGPPLSQQLQAERPRVLLLELDRADLGELSAMSAAGELRGIRVVAFASHVREDLAEQGRAAGVAEVVTKGELGRHLMRLMTEQA